MSDKCKCKGKCCSVSQSGNCKGSGNDYAKGDNTKGVK